MWRYIPSNLYPSDRRRGNKWNRFANRSSRKPRGTIYHSCLNNAPHLLKPYYTLRSSRSKSRNFPDSPVPHRERHTVQSSRMGTHHKKNAVTCKRGINTSTPPSPRLLHQKERARRRLRKQYNYDQHHQHQHHTKNTLRTKQMVTSPNLHGPTIKESTSHWLEHAPWNNNRTFSRYGRW